MVCKVIVTGLGLCIDNRYEMSAIQSRLPKTSASDMSLRVYIWSVLGLDVRFLPQHTYKARTRVRAASSRGRVPVSWL